jgi:hypothetical protein
MPGSYHGADEPVNVENTSKTTPDERMHDPPDTTDENTAQPADAAADESGSDTEVPEAVHQLLLAARARIADNLGVEPDLSCETMPLLDGYLRAMGEQLDSDERQQVLEELGCHFGEVLRRKLNGHWSNTDDQPPTAWRVELESCFLYLHPVGMTGEVLLGCESELHDGSLATSDDQHELLAEMLAHAAPMSEEAYFSLSGRIDVLELVADFLTGRRLVDGKGKTPEPYTRADYAAHVASRSAN